MVRRNTRLSRTSRCFTAGPFQSKMQEIVQLCEKNKATPPYATGRARDRCCDTFGSSPIVSSEIGVVNEIEAGGFGYRPLHRLIIVMISR